MSLKQYLFLILFCKWKYVQNSIPFAMMLSWQNNNKNKKKHKNSKKQMLFGLEMHNMGLTLGHTGENTHIHPPQNHKTTHKKISK